MGGNSRWTAACAMAIAIAMPGAVQAEGTVQKATDLADAAVAKARLSMMEQPGKAFIIGRDLERTVQSLPVDRNRTIALARARWIAGEASLRLGRIDQGRAMLDSSLALASIASDPRSKADALLSRANMRHDHGNPAGALIDYQMAYRLYQRIGQARGQSIALQFLGNLYGEAADFDRAARYLRQSSEVYQKEPMLLLTLANNLGNILIDANDLKGAAVEYRRAARIAGENNSPMIQSMILSNLARTYADLGDRKAAVRTLETARRLSRADGSEPGTEILITSAYMNQASGRTQEAMRDIEKVLQADASKGTTKTDMDVHSIAFSIYRSARMPEKALGHLERTRVIEKSFSRIALDNKNALMSAQFDFANQELRIAGLKQEDLKRSIASERATKRRQLVIFLIAALAVAAVIAALVVALVVIRRSRDRITAMNASLQQALLEIRDREVAEKEATQLAEHDALTGLPNRRSLADRIFPDAVARLQPGEECSILLLDLDRFKPINDTYGHEVGDGVLVEAADRLRRLCLQYGAQPVRLGGDEFIILLNSRIGGEAAKRLCTELIHEISAPYLVGELRLTIGVSIGVARHPDDGSTIAELLRDADVAMYEAKRNGRGSFRLYTADMDQQLRERADLEADLRGAVREGQIHAHFQPIHCFETGRIQSFEALARWEHPDRGSISPEAFIPIAEESGLIDEITTAIIQQACRAARDWPDSISLNVNLSPVLLRDDWIATRIFGILNAEGVNPRRLVIEITENAVIDDLDHARAMIASFRSAGIRVALDDFGKGYSSLSHLRDLAFDILKLDASFCRTLDDEDSLKITTIVAGLAQALDMPVTAEGVETAEAAAILDDLGFTYAQGYLYGRALPREQTLELVMSEATTLEAIAA